MKRTGFFRKVNEVGDLKTYRNVQFESTGIDCPGEAGHKIWRRLYKDGTPSNTFAIQFQPNVPWAVGNWFIMIDGGWVLSNFPQLKLETERSKTMTDKEYIEYLSSRYFA